MNQLNVKYKLRCQIWGKDEGEDAGQLNGDNDELNIPGGFNNQLQQLMFSSDFSEFHIVQEFAVYLYRRSKSERLPRSRIQTPRNGVQLFLRVDRQVCPLG